MSRHVPSLLQVGGLHPRRFSGLCAACVGGVFSLAVPAPLPAKIKSPAERIEDLEKKIEGLEDKVQELEKEQAAGSKEKEKEKEKAAGGGTKEEENLFSGGVLTIGKVKLRLGGKAEFLFIDTQSENDPVLGATDEPDPHFEVNRLRLEPRLDFNREISLHAQIDFKPDPGQVILKEM